MKVREAQKLRNTLLLVGFLIMIAGYVWTPFTIIGVVVTCSCIVPDFLYNKCPHCGRRLGRNEGEICHHCGERID